jgi:hypothetical protein
MSLVPLESLNGDILRVLPCQDLLLNKLRKGGWVRELVLEVTYWPVASEVLSIHFLALLGVWLVKTFYHLTEVTLRPCMKTRAILELSCWALSLVKCENLCCRWLSWSKWVDLNQFYFRWNHLSLIMSSKGGVLLGLRNYLLIYDFEILLFLSCSWVSNRRASLLLI